MSEEIDFSSVTGFADALAQSSETFIPFATDAMTASVRLIQGGLAEYPPGTEANQPGRFSLKTGRPMGYYERGLGWWYPIMTRETIQAAAKGQFGKARGAVKASRLTKTLSRVQGYKLIRSSEQLGKSWATDIQVSGGGVQGEVGTNTSYAPYVQGDEQSSVLAKYGWDAHQLDVVIDDLMPDLDSIWNSAADDFVKELAQ